MSFSFREYGLTQGIMLHTYTHFRLWMLPFFFSKESGHTHVTYDVVYFSCDPNKATARDMYVSIITPFCLFFTTLVVASRLFLFIFLSYRFILRQFYHNMQWDLNQNSVWKHHVRRKNHLVNNDYLWRYEFASVCRLLGRICPFLCQLSK